MCCDSNFKTAQMPKSSKRFTISDSRLNSHGFRMLTSGADIEDFKNNPIMYWMHVYPTGEKPDERLPIGFWEDIQVEGDKITAIPNFDDSDTFAMTVYNKVEHGTLRACSAGAEPVELSSDSADLVKGQTLPTFIKWILREASIVDRGSNAGAVALKIGGRLITLNDDASDILNSLLTTQKEKMKIVTLTAPAMAVVLSALKLNAETVTEAEITEAVSKLVTLAATQETQIVKLNAEKAAAETKATEAENKLTEQVKLANTAKIETLVQKAVEDRKITAAEKTEYVKLAEGNFESVEKLLNAKAAAPTIQQTLTTATGTETEAQKLEKLSWDELHRSDKLETVKANHPEIYKLKYKEQFGTEPK